MSTNRQPRIAILRRVLNVLLVPAAIAVAPLAWIGMTQAAAPLQSLDDIRSRAEALLRSQVPAAGESRAHYVSAGHLDNRLRLAACQGPLQASRLATSVPGPRNTVSVSCRQGADWTVQVPVMLESEGPVLVTKRPVERATQLTVADVETQVRRVPGPASHHVSDIAAVAGQQTRRWLPTGTVLTADMFARTPLVRRGQQVTLTAAVGGIEVRAVGRALADGGAMDRIRVQNLTSSRVVEGLVESATIVRTTP